MNEPVYFWRYLLRGRAKLNAVSARRELEGVLLRVGDGFGCLQPWPELGDPPLAELLDDLAADEPESRLVRRALFMAETDAGARCGGRAVWADLQEGVPESHATLPEVTFAAVEEAVRSGYSVIKVKGDRDIAAMASRLDEITRRWPRLRWRVDFNAVLSVEETIAFAQCLTEHAHKRIDFLEDPVPWDPVDWTRIRDRTGLALALDRGAFPGAAAADTLIVKPARDDFEPVRYRQRIVVTSNMDHPLGQCFAAWSAARICAAQDHAEFCGLQTHDLFEPTEFSECLGPAGPRFRCPDGTGFGFDDLLANLPWKRLR